MWVCFNDGFISAVADRHRPGRLVVRARKRKHLERLFPGKRIIVTPQADYGFRVSVSRKAFAKMVVRRIGQIDYSNFKDSVRDDDLHDLYLKMWGLHFRYQNSDSDGRWWERMPPFAEPVTSKTGQRHLPFGDPWKGQWEKRLEESAPAYEHEPPAVDEFLRSKGGYHG